MRDRPPCLQALELDLPCTEEQVLAAYRRRVKELHPDRGGDLQQFLRLQKHFEQAHAPGAQSRQSGQDRPRPASAADADHRRGARTQRAFWTLALPRVRRRVLSAPR